MYLNFIPIKKKIVKVDIKVIIDVPKSGCKDINIVGKIIRKKEKINLNKYIFSSDFSKIFDIIIGKDIFCNSDG